MTSFAKGLSVVICCYNSTEKLAPTFEALANQCFNSLTHFPIEVLVIDNASTDGTADFAEKKLAVDFPFSYRIVYEGKAGKTFALSTGINEAAYSYVCVVDDDNWLSSTYLQTAWDIMESNPHIGMLGGCGEPVLEGPAPEWFDKFAICYAAASQAPDSGDVTQTTRFVYGAGSVMRKEGWETIHNAGFKFLLTGNTGSQLTSGEDNELCYALIIAGYKIWYDSRLKFKHFIPLKRMTWDYIQKLFKSFAYSAATLRPYVEYLEKSNSKFVSSKIKLQKPLIWFRVAKLMIPYIPKVFEETKKDGARRFKEGGFYSMHAICYCDIIVNLLKKGVENDKAFLQVEHFVNSLHIRATKN